MWTALRFRRFRWAGLLDLDRVVRIVRHTRPEAHFNLEMITRDQLKIPCLTDNYWKTFPQRNGQYLAHGLTLVRAHKTSHPYQLCRAMGN
jgi:3-oxoisoapionate decarboxylase